MQHLLFPLLTLYSTFCTSEFFCKLNTFAKQDFWSILFRSTASLCIFLCFFTVKYLHYFPGQKQNAKLSFTEHTASCCFYFKLPIQLNYSSARHFSTHQGKTTFIVLPLASFEWHMSRLFHFHGSFVITQEREDQFYGRFRSLLVSMAHFTSFLPPSVVFSFCFCHCFANEGE